MGERGRDGEKGVRADFQTGGKYRMVQVVPYFKYGTTWTIFDPVENKKK